MFLRWRKAAAALGALWFPGVMAHGPSLDAAIVYRGAACAGYHATAGARAWYNYDHEDWYERYYRNEWNDTAIPVSVTRDSGARTGDYPLSDCAGAHDDLANAFESEDVYGNAGASDSLRTSNAADAICPDPTCPCHNAPSENSTAHSGPAAAVEAIDDPIDDQFVDDDQFADFADEDSLPGYDGRSPIHSYESAYDAYDDSDAAFDASLDEATERATTLDGDASAQHDTERASDRWAPLAGPRHYTDIYEPYMYDDEACYGSGRSYCHGTPAADGWRPAHSSGQESTGRSIERRTPARLTGSIEPITDAGGHRIDDEDTGELPSDDVSAAAVLSPYHMFYPGYNWVPYCPAAAAGGPAIPAPTATHSGSDKAAPSPMLFQGAAWISQGTVGMVTWTAKLAETVGSLVGSPPARSQPSVRSASRRYLPL